MGTKTFHRLQLFSLFFLALWFFGNLYEEVVLAPNQLVNTLEALSCWQHYFTVTNQIYYYVPFTHLAVVGVVILFFYSKDQVQKTLLKKAVIYGVLSVVITVMIVTQLNMKIFFGDLALYQDDLFTFSLLWLIGNAVRIYLVGTALYYTFQSYCRLLVLENVHHHNAAAR